MNTQLQFCETYLSDGIEVFNTVSTLAYILAGIIIVYQVVRIKPIDLRLIMLGILTMYLGLAIMYLHITKSQVGLLIDVSAMLVWVLYTTTFFFLTLSTLQKICTYLFVIGIIIISFMVNDVLISLVPFVVLGTVSLFTQLRLHPEIQNSIYFRFGLVSLIIGLLFWQADVHGLYCNPALVFVNGHTIWHILTAIVIWCVYKLIVHFKL